MSLTCGSTIIESHPFVHCLHADKKGLLCDYCFKESSKLSRCSKCKYMYYCSPTCQKSDWIIHKTECPEFIQIKTSDRFRPCLKSETARLYIRILIHTKINEASGQTDENGLKTFNDLMDNYAALMRDNIKQQDVFAYYMLIKDFIGEDFILKFTEKEIFSNYGKLLTNKFEVKNEENEHIGVGIYLSAASLDHSCEPNCEIKFDGSKIIIKLIRDLMPNEQPLISYCDMSMNKQERQSFLKENYFFNCKCVKCIEIEPSFEISLPCGHKTEYKNFMYQPNSTDCFVCKNHKLNLDECLSMAINRLNIHKYKYDNEAHKHAGLKRDLSMLRVKNEIYVNEEMDRLKNTIDLRREELRKKIDDYYFTLLDQIESKRRSGLKEIDLKCDQIESFQLPVVPAESTDETKIKSYAQSLKQLEGQVKSLNNFIRLNKNEKCYEIKTLKDFRIEEVFGQCSFNEKFILDNFKFEINKEYKGHTGHVMRAQFIGTDKLISVCDDGTLRLWDKTSTKCLRVYRHRVPQPVCLIVLDEQHFITDSLDVIKLWNIDEDDCVKEFERTDPKFQDAVYCLMVSKNGELMCGSESGIEVWDLKTAKSILKYQPHEDSVYYLEETFDGQVLSGSADKTIKLLDRKKGPVKTYTGHREAIRVLKMINKDTFASGSRDKTVKIWCLETGECLKTLGGYAYTVTFLDLLDKYYLMSCCVDGLVKVWNIEKGTCVMSIQTRRGEVCHLNEAKNEIINIGVNQEVIQLWKNNVLF